MQKTLVTGATMSVTGGTNQVFGETGEALTSGKVLADTADANYFTRAKLNITTREPSLDSVTGSWSKNKRTITYVQPKTLADGTVIYNTVRVEVSMHPESTAAELTEIRKKGAQALIDSELDTFYTLGDLS